MKDGKVPSLLGGDQKRFLRMDTLGEAYTPEALRAIIKGIRQHIPKAKLVEEFVDVPAENLIELMEARLNANNGAGRSRIQKVIDLKQLASAYIYLEDHHLLDRVTLETKVAEVSQRYSKLKGQIKQIEDQLNENQATQTQIINYKKTRDVYVAYRKAGYSKKFLPEHESDIIKHKAAKKFFDERGMTKWPTIKTLRLEFDTLLSKKRALYSEYKKAEKEVRELQKAKHYVDRVLGDDAVSTEKERQAEQR